MKAVVVTGAARGIGLAATRLFLAEGWRVAMVDRDAEELAKAADALEDAVPLVCDVSQPDQVARLTGQAVAALGRVDALVNNAGVAHFGPIGACDFDIWRTVMATNLDGPFLVSQAFTAELARSGTGAIVNIASISGLRASTLRVAYGTSKAGVIQLTRQQAAELGELGIRVNCIAPGPVDTKLSRAVHSQAIRAAYHDAIPLNRYGSETEIAEAIVFLCSARASYVTGQVLAVDGGFEAVGIGLPDLRE